MTNSTSTATPLSHLKVIVERAVRPVHAVLPRKLAMREELLGHVTDVFEEELTRTGDEAAALAETARRFGDPREVTEELQQTVPARERPYLWIERFTEPRPGEPIMKRAIRLAVLIAAICGGGIAAGILPQIAWGDAPLSIAMRVIMAATAGTAVMTFGFVVLEAALRQAAFDRTKSLSLVRAIIVAIAACLLPLAVLAVLSVMTLGSVTESVGFLRRIVTDIPLIPLLPLSPALLFLATWQLQKERRYISSWAELQID